MVKAGHQEADQSDRRKHKPHDGSPHAEQCQEWNANHVPDQAGKGEPGEPAIGAYGVPGEWLRHSLYLRESLRKVSRAAEGGRLTGISGWSGRAAEVAAIRAYTSWR